MKKKITLLFIAVGAIIMHTSAQTDLVTNGNMTGTTLNYVGQASTVATPAAGSNSGWIGVFGGVTANRALDIVSTTDSDTGSGQGDVVKVLATGNNTDLTNNARLAQRLASTPVGIYRLKFKAKATTLNTTKLTVTVRSGGNNVPTCVLDGYVTGSALATGFSDFTLTQSWLEYTVDFDLTRTASTFSASPTIATLTANFYPVISFSLPSATGAECMLDDVSFIAKSFYTGIQNLKDGGEKQLVVRSANNQLQIENVAGSVSVYNALGKLIDLKEAVGNFVSFDVNTKGIYIISNGKNKIKVVV